MAIQTSLSSNSSLTEESTQIDWRSSSDQVGQLLKASPAFFLEALTTTRGEPTKLEPYQIRFLQDRSKFRLVVKSRQIGFSWVIAGEGLHRVVTNSGRNVNYVSINQKEASGKIDYAKAFYYSMPEQLRPPVYTQAEFEFGVHGSPHTSVMVSQPASSAIRGGEKDIYLDEFAFIPQGAKLYDAALPATTRGDSRVTIVSTPLGQSGLFFDIANDRHHYEMYTVHIVPWWECSIMSVDPTESTAIATDYDTEERVMRWGTPSIRSIFKSMDLTSFQQEYECSFADETVSFYPWSLIIRSVDDQLNTVSWKSDVAYNIGIDVAKKVDKTVVTVSTTDEETGLMEIHKTFEMAGRYEDQENEMIALVKEIKPQRVTIDATGVGERIAERLEGQFGGLVEPIVFTLQNKTDWATTFKADMQSDKVKFPRKRELLDQIHTLERKRSEAGNYIFKAREGKHDDYYWSAMLSLYGRGRVAPSISFAW